VKEHVDSTNLRSPSLTPVSPRTSSWKRVEKKWNQVQVGHQGSYSVERPLLQQHLTDSSDSSLSLDPTTVAHCGGCLGVFAFELAIGRLGVELFRISLMLLLINIAGASQANLFVPGYNQTVRQVIYASLVVSALQTGAFILEAVIVGFPVPFIWQIGAVTMGIFVPLVIRLVNGGQTPAVFVKGSALAQHHKRLLNTFFVHLALIGVFPLCRVLYDLIPRSYRGFVVVIVPIWKFTAKRFAVRMVHELEDFVPELVAFSCTLRVRLHVDVRLTALFITVDIVFALVKFRNLNKNERVLRQLLQDRRRCQSSHLINTREDTTFSSGLLSTILEVVRNPKAYQVSSLDRVRLYASPPHVVPENLYKRLQIMGMSCSFGGHQSNLTRVSSYQHAPKNLLTSWKFRQISVVPASMPVVPVKAQTPTNLRKENSVKPTEPSKYLVLHGLQLLFNCEYLVLVEYIECVVPFVFVLYKSALEQLPNVVYFPGGAGHWGITAVTNLVVFGVLEVGSLLLLHVFLQRKFGFSPLYQLAFVLETQASAIQAHLFPVTIFLLQYQLAHLGTYSFAEGSLLLHFAKLESTVMEGVSGSCNSDSRSLTPPSSRILSWKRVEKRWNQVQVGNQGSYSVERLELLDHYCNSTPLSRVILVCLLTPLPALTVAVVLECLPLQPPSVGWASNWMFWLRVILMLLSVNIAGASQGNLFVQGYNQTVRQVIYASLAITILQTGTFVLEAAIIGFPMPFMWQTGAVTMGVFVPLVTRCVNGPAVFVNGIVLAQHYKQLLNSFFVQMALIGVYPLCRVLYDSIPRSYRDFVVIIIPIWKFTAKRFAVRMVHELEDFVPELVAFSVDFFSALFVSVCMSTSGSFHLTALFITVDIVFALVKFRNLNKNERVLRQLLQDRRRCQSSHLINTREDTTFSSGLLSTILEVVRNPKAYQVSSLDRVRLYASPPHVVPENLYKRLQIMGMSCSFGGHQSNLTRVSSYQHAPKNLLTSWKFRQISVVPASMPVVPVKAQPPTNLRKENSVKPTEPSKYLVLHGLQLLFNCEYLVLVEYIECVVPFVFVLYKSALEQLPNVVYFPGGAGHWGITAVTNLVVFGVLEIGSLLLLHVFLQRKFGFSPLYQLAFVLETQASAIQAHLFPVTIFLLQYLLAHLGADFTFRFEWLRNKSE
ncbi:hypothetical protein GN958_ATG14473, partial [Phytophthora infestans]